MLFGADIIHAHSTYPSGYTVATVGSLQRLPLVITPHGEDIHMIPKIGFGLRLNPEMDQKIKVALKRAQLLTAISEGVKQSLLNAGAAESKIFEIPNGIDLERFQGDAKPGIKGKLGLAETNKIILSVGKYHPRKGHDILIRSMPRILRRHPDARLVVVGLNQGPLEKLTRECGLMDKVVLTGPIPFPPLNLARRNDRGGEIDLLAELYKVCDVYVSASMDEGAEGLSLALLDAMGARRPVVATAVSGNKDLVVDGKTGYLVSPGSPQEIADAVIRILGDPKIGSCLGQNAGEVAKFYSWETVAKQYAALYRCAVKLSENPKRVKIPVKSKL
jgi:glycosyltransferase involved in cell wall biosynthesis